MFKHPESLQRHSSQSVFCQPSLSVLVSQSWTLVLDSPYDEFASFLFVNLFLPIEKRSSCLRYLPFLLTEGGRRPFTQLISFLQLRHDNVRAAKMLSKTVWFLDCKDFNFLGIVTVVGKIFRILVWCQT